MILKKMQILKTKLKVEKVDLSKNLELFYSKNFTELKVLSDRENFKIYSIDELLKKSNVDGIESYTILNLRGYVNTLKQVMGENTFDQNGNLFSLSRLESSLIIGYKNTEILFVDSKDSNSISIFYPSGGDVEITNIKLEEIIK